MAKPLFIVGLAATTPVLIYILGWINYYTDYIQHLFEEDASQSVYDFIVVGSGSSGAVVALRLAQYYKVLILEAGGEPLPFNKIPGLALDLLGYPEFDWNYTTVPQTKAGYGMENNQIASNRGRVLGGTSILNYMLYLRGNSLDYDNWANITEDSEWKYENLLPFFKKSIKEYRGSFKSNKKHYEASPYGFLTIEAMNFAPMRENFLRAAEEIGYKSFMDVNGPQSEGFGNIEVTQNHGERMSTHAAILKDLVYNANIRILKRAQATKVKLDKSGNAVGVWYSHYGKRKLAIASKEVILSAGSYDSPKLLMLSGIGPKEELQKHGIKSKIDLPVGKNLQDHIASFVFPITINTTTSIMVERDLGLGAFYDYFVNGGGLLTAPSALNAQGFFSTAKAKMESGGMWPNIQLLYLPIASSQALKETFIRALYLKPEILDEVMDPHVGKDGFVLLSVLVRPKSRGQVTLKDKNPFSDPLIDPKFFSDADDLKAMLESFHFALKMIEGTKAFQEVGAKVGEIPIPGCKTHKFRSDAYLECYLRHLTGTIWHPVGTCAMGRPNEKSTVVDSKLRVLGVRGLRVIDASIMPVIVNANTNAPAIMIGEKGADMILDHWSKQKLVSHPQHIFFKTRSKHHCYYK